MKADTGGYDPAHFEKLAPVEERHFWFRARFNLIRKLARRALEGVPAPRVLEAGCGTGYVLRALHQACPEGVIVGLDMFGEGLRFARERNPDANLVQADVSLFPFSKRFHLIGLFDVLEHVPADRQLLADLFSMLEPSGKLLVTVPAHMSLWSDVDVLAGHCRRYALTELREKLETAGFHVEFISGYMAAILPLVWAMRRLRGAGNGTSERAAGRVSTELRPIPGVNQALLAILNLEGLWTGRLKRLPVGASLIAMATRPPGTATEPPLRRP